MDSIVPCLRAFEDLGYYLSIPLNGFLVIVNPVVGSETAVSFQFHWMDSWTCSRMCCYLLSIPLNGFESGGKFAPQRVNVKAFNSIEWILAVSHTATSNAKGSFNSIEWILYFWPISDLFLLRLGSFNSIEWILPPLGLCFLGSHVILSIPLNGFPSRPWRRLKRGRLSIPLNGFTRALLDDGSEVNLPFNSIEWIPLLQCHRPHHP